MKIAAIMPTYNQVLYIREAVESVLPQVDRLVVVDDGSTDGTAEYLKGLRLKGWHLVVRDRNAGTAEAINAGYATLGDEEWVTWVSSDNFTLPVWRSLVEREVGDDVGVIYTGYLRCDASLRAMAPFYRDYHEDALINDENCFFGPSFVIARKIWDAVGGHRGKISHDYDHWLRVEEECWRQEARIVAVNEPGVLYRVHDKRVTVTRRGQYDAAHWRLEARKRRGLD